MKIRNQNNICLACSSERIMYWFEKVTNQGEYHIYRCSDCKSAFVLPRPSSSEIATVYEVDQYRKTDDLNISEQFTELLKSEVEYPNSSIDAARMINNIKNLANGKSFLDIGGGYGFFSKAALSAGFNVTAIEPSPACREIFTLMNAFTPEAGMLDKIFVNKYTEKFNIILMSQVLEHIADLDETLDYLNMLLDRKGIVVIAVPHFKSLVSFLQGKNDMFIIPPEHLNFFSMQGLIALFSRHNFKLLKQDTISRVPPASIHKIMPIKLLTGVAKFTLETILHFADTIGKGMFINCYFRKER